ncbi:hypothetical protein, partial [Agrobacterium pusense]|uniref:hypothetical protein n=1 Tax=Agrobacterium pusense TaxID=648995 RepID=UPI003FD60193
VSGLINPSPQTSQHTYRQKTDIFGKLLKYITIISHLCENPQNAPNPASVLLRTGHLRLVKRPSLPAATAILPMAHLRKRRGRLSNRRVVL